MPAHPTSDLKVTIVRVLRMHLVSMIPVMHSKQTLNLSVQPSQAGKLSGFKLFMLNISLRLSAECFHRQQWTMNRGCQALGKSALSCVWKVMHFSYIIPYIDTEFHRPTEDQHVWGIYCWTQAVWHIGFYTTSQIFSCSLCYPVPSGYNSKIHCLLKNSRRTRSWVLFVAVLLEVTWAESDKWHCNVYFN